MTLSILFVYLIRILAVLGCYEKPNSCIDDQEMVVYEKTEFKQPSLMSDDNIAHYLKGQLEVVLLNDDTRVIVGLRLNSGDIACVGIDEATLLDHAIEITEFPDNAVYLKFDRSILMEIKRNK